MYSAFLLYPQLLLCPGLVESSITVAQQAQIGINLAMVYCRKACTFPSANHNQLSIISLGS